MIRLFQMIFVPRLKGRSLTRLFASPVAEVETYCKQSGQKDEGIGNGVVTPSGSTEGAPASLATWPGRSRPCFDGTARAQESPD